MHDSETRQRPLGRGADALALIGVLLAAISGCSDHRISLQEFLASEQEAAESEKAAVPTSQPVDVATIDKELGPYKVGPGDVLVITLTGLEEAATLAPMNVRVDRDGQIQVPAVGRIPVEGKELQDVEEAIQKAYVPKVYQDVVVHVVVFEPRFTRVLVTGAVITPGLVQLRRTERNLLFAIVAAGGVSATPDMASGTVTLKRLRQPDKEVTLALTDPEQLKTALALDPLQDGDVVNVNAAPPNTIFVGGLVAAARPESYPPGVKITVLQAIAAAGGLRTDVFPTEATLIRRRPDGTDVQVKMDLGRVTTGKDPNIYLAAGDVLWVPDTLATRVQDWCNKNMFLRFGASANYNFNYSSEGLNPFNSPAKAQTNAYNNSMQQQIDPFGYLLRNQGLSNLVGRPTPTQ